MLEYGENALEIAKDAISHGARIVIHDDVLATGGTLVAAHELVAALGATVVGTTVLMELDALGGREAVGDVHSLFHA